MKWKDCKSRGLGAQNARFNVLTVKRTFYHLHDPYPLATWFLANHIWNHMYFHEYFQKCWTSDERQKNRISRGAASQFFKEVICNQINRPFIIQKCVRKVDLWWSEVAPRSNLSKPKSATSSQNANPETRCGFLESRRGRSCKLPRL
jgi:hypothetical protein